MLEFHLDGIQEGVGVVGAAGFLESSAWLGVGVPTLKGVSERELRPAPTFHLAMPPARKRVHA